MKVQRKMDRTFTLNMTQTNPQHGENMAIGLIAFVHLVGVVGMLSPLREFFQTLTPYNLIFSALVIGMVEKERTQSLLWVLLGSFVAGYLVEVAGVATGSIFGEYSYGETLGFKLFDVPLVIGLNWALLVFCTGNITSRLPINNSLKAAAAAALMTGLDFLIEPVAIALDFWSWESVAVPIQNYIAWFLIASVMLRAFHAINRTSVNRVAVGVFVVQVVFFGLLWALL